MSSFLSAILFLIFFIFLGFVIYQLYIVLPTNMARKRGRSVPGCILLFFLVSPLWGAMILMVLGDSHEKIRDEMMDERRRSLDDYWSQNS